MGTFWSIRRKIVYGLGALFALTSLCTYIFRDTLFPTPTCYDGKVNAFEAGVDCGGECRLRCSQDIVPLSVVWSRSVRTSITTYDLVGLVSNKNVDNAPRPVGYVFTLFDRSGGVMATLRGTTTVPLDGDFPVIMQNVSLAAEPASVSLALTPNISHYTTIEKPSSPTVRVTSTRYEAGSIPRVYATILNTKRLQLRDLPVRVLLYGADGNVFAVGQSIVPFLGKESSQEVVFTWTEPFTVAPTRTIVYPILDPFLGTL